MKSCPIHFMLMLSLLPFSCKHREIKQASNEAIETLPQLPKGTWMVQSLIHQINPNPKVSAPQWQDLPFTELRIEVDSAKAIMEEAWEKTWAYAYAGEDEWAIGDWKCKVLGEDTLLLISKKDTYALSKVVYAKDYLINGAASTAFRQKMNAWLSNGSFKGAYLDSRGNMQSNQVIFRADGSMAGFRDMGFYRFLFNAAELKRSDALLLKCWNGLEEQLFYLRWLPFSIELYEVNKANRSNTLSPSGRIALLDRQ